MKPWCVWARFAQWMIIDFTTRWDIYGLVSTFLSHKLLGIFLRETFGIYYVGVYYSLKQTS